MDFPPGARRLSLVVLLAAAAFLVVAPGGFGYSGGICIGCEGTSNAPPGDFATIGCTVCHGPGAPHGEFAEGSMELVYWEMVDAEGNGPVGNTYTHEAEYTVTLTLDERNAPAAANHAGFNLRASAGKLAAVPEQSQVSSDGSQATHVSPGRTSWQVLWTAPAEGPAVFDLFVNDVDGSGAPDPADEVHRVGWFLTDEEHTLPGAVQEEVEFGITLQQYWIGLIGLAGMIFVMVATFVYLRFVNPHNTDPKDR